MAAAWGRTAETLSHSHLEHFSLMTFGTTISNSDSSQRTTVIQTDLRNEGLDHLTTHRELARFDRD